MKKNARKLKGTSAHTQRCRILAYLKKHGSATTMQIRNELCIMGSSQRVSELKAKGHNIITHKTSFIDPEGTFHGNVANYVYHESNIGE